MSSKKKTVPQFPNEEQDSPELRGNDSAVDTAQKYTTQERTTEQLLDDAQAAKAAFEQELAGEQGLASGKQWIEPQWIESELTENAETEPELTEPEFLAIYWESYPNENELLVTTDGNVFLPDHLNDANNHAALLGSELKTYKRN